MELESLKEALGSEKFSALKTYVDDLVGQRDAARNESINGRKGKDATIKELRERIALLSDKLGVDPDGDLSELPDAKGQAEAVRQFEAQLKRAARERDEAIKTRDEALGKFRTSQQKAALADAMNGHKFIARDLVEAYVGQRTVWEGDELLFKSDDGKLLTLKDAVAGFAKTRPELLEPQGAGGAGIRQPNASGGGNAKKTMTRAEFEALPPADRVETARAGVTLT